ncbi:hypothetical protein PLESTB_001384200 [Pleodorina starrii]|uniref:Uncharacterized protein n=1 Tax=Pleodorina starrii TaxID=330485 RepID=A0A9W6F6Z9_9CHLO|nr:hypothetical protein PLESTM_000947800 [Pleodorina starrii]GLC57746.1 hypothetical protein PLESTB_001260200 [Pleodorina starrii]GLC58649.1 hypothetical protein PLESTB_001384200 [Pleodorina starrii]GLC74889.1 hypothetical protein PLESTF_001568500 [Pleodorina starrii]
MLVLPGNKITGTLQDWPAAASFLDQLQLETRASYSIQSQKHAGGVVARYYRCKHGGKPSWEAASLPQVPEPQPAAASPAADQPPSPEPCATKPATSQAATTQPAAQSAA